MKKRSMMIKVVTWLSNNIYIYIKIQLFSPNCALHTSDFQFNAILKPKLDWEYRIILIVKYNATNFLKIVKNFITKHIHIETYYLSQERKKFYFL